MASLSFHIDILPTYFLVCNKEKKVAANTGVQGEGSAVDATPQDIRENSAIEFSFFAVEVENSFGILEQVD